MARKNSNARRRYKPRPIRVKPNVIVKRVTKKQDDGMSPGRLVAIAEWRWGR